MVLLQILLCSFFILLTLPLLLWIGNNFWIAIKKLFKLIFIKEKKQIYGWCNDCKNFVPLNQHENLLYCKIHMNLCSKIGEDKCPNCGGFHVGAFCADCGYPHKVHLELVKY